MLGSAAERFRIVNHFCVGGRFGERGAFRAWWRMLVEPDLGGGGLADSDWVYRAAFLRWIFLEAPRRWCREIAGFRTVQHFHRASLIAHPETTSGGKRGNNPSQKIKHARRSGFVRRIDCRRT